MRFILSVPHDWERGELIKFAAVPQELDEDDLDDILAILDEAEKIADPKVLYKVSKITSRDDNGLWFDGVRIDSALVAENLKDTDTVYPYVCTCGRELYDWAQKISDPLLRFYADKAMIFYLGRAVSYLYNLLRENYISTGFAVHMNPGSLVQWPLPQQKNLFELLEDVEKDIGVHLTESYLMIPEKSGSGFYYRSEVDYSNCDLCPNTDCPNRRTTNHC